jgi:hypothetical protein
MLQLPAVGLQPIVVELAPQVLYYAESVRLGLRGVGDNRVLQPGQRRRDVERIRHLRVMDDRPANPMPVLRDQRQRIGVPGGRQLHVGKPASVDALRTAIGVQEVELRRTAIDDALQGGQQRLITTTELADIAVVQMFRPSERRQQPPAFGGTPRGGRRQPGQ